MSFGVNWINSNSGRILVELDKFKFRNDIGKNWFMNGGVYE